LRHCGKRKIIVFVEFKFCEEADHLVSPLHFAQNIRNAEVEKRKRRKKSVFINLYPYG
jgi:hypothetical protein